MTVVEIQEKLDSLHSKMMNSSITNGVTMAEIKALFESRTLIEKQIPKKPRVKPLGQDIEVECPTCGNVHIFLDTKKGDKYCNHCGQKIDWEEGGTSD